MKKALLVDFDDSFTFNIVQELEEQGLIVKTLHWLDFESLPETDLLVLGPGPGHPDDYVRIFPLFEEWIKQKRSLFGVCLGHQIYWRILGEPVLQSKEPLQVQKVKMTLRNEWQKWLELPPEVSVQRYNSLTVLGQSASRFPYLTNMIMNDEILITRGEKVLTYQFHPESMGTSFRSRFFRPVIREIV
jgi:para-aminobenzoate synthetase component 2